MCGICGSTRDPDASAVRTMCGVLRHRGPDDEGVHVDRESGVAIGARRLSIIDVAGGHQPLSNEDGSVWVVLNGEIYNHPALQAQLREHGHVLSTATDTEVLVHLYEDYGEALVHALEGMFAFALWDSRQERLVLGRDRFGEKPLFYSERSGGLTFASELSALRAAGAAGDELDLAAVDDYFVFGYVPGPRSIVRGVRQLPPGHLLVWDRSGGTRLERYWAPLPAEVSSGESLWEIAAETRSLLEASVRSRMISDVPLGVFLSGGLDSTLIALLAARSSGHPIKTFTVGYDVGAVSETEAARETAAELGAEHRELLLTARDVGAMAPELLARLDQPLADQALVALHAVAGLARQEVTVVVGGEGADELFGGYPRYRWLARADSLGRVAPEGLARRAARALAAAPFGGRARRLAEVVAPRPALERHLDWVTDGRRHLRPHLYGASLRASHDGRVLQDLATLAEEGDGAPIGRFMRLDQLHWLPDDVLAKADRASMLVSLEVRTPYLHHELAELAAALSPNEHVRNHGKAVLRALLAELLPSTRRRRPKRAFRVPSREWLRGPLADTLEAQLAGGALYREGWFERQAVGALAREHAAGARDWSHALWPLLALGLWLDRFRGSDAN